MGCNQRGRVVRGRIDVVSILLTVAVEFTASNVFAWIVGFTYSPEINRLYRPKPRTPAWINKLCHQACSHHCTWMLGCTSFFIILVSMARTKVVCSVILNRLSLLSVIDVAAVGFVCLAIFSIQRLNDIRFSLKFFLQPPSLSNLLLLPAATPRTYHKWVVFSLDLTVGGIGGSLALMCEHHEL